MTYHLEKWLDENQALLKSGVGKDSFKFHVLLSDCIAEYFRVKGYDVVSDNRHAICDKYPKIDVFVKVWEYEKEAFFKGVKFSVYEHGDVAVGLCNNVLQEMFGDVPEEIYFVNSSLKEA